MSQTLKRYNSTTDFKSYLMQSEQYTSNLVYNYNLKRNNSLDLESNHPSFQNF